MGYSARNRVQLVKGGRDYFLLLKKLINKATHSIHLQFYIFLDDETGKEIIEALKSAARRGGCGSPAAGCVCFPGIAPEKCAGIKE